jgi:hypothetical protein
VTIQVLHHLLTGDLLQVPNAFQHILAWEKTPTLGNALPAFERMKQTWEKMQTDLPETAILIQPGLDKLVEYQGYADANPTYILATGMLKRQSMLLLLTYIPLIVLNPRLKLRWFIENAPHETNRAKGIVLAEVLNSN